MQRSQRGKKQATETFRSVAFGQVARHGSIVHGRTGKQRKLVAQKDTTEFACRSMCFAGNGESSLGYMVKRLSAHGGCLGSKRR